MITKFLNWIIKKKTKNLTRIPLFVITFNYREWEKDKKSKNCHFYCHPDIEKDEFVKENLCEVVDHIRENYDMERFTEV